MKKSQVRNFPDGPQNCKVVSLSDFRKPFRTTAQQRRHTRIERERREREKRPIYCAQRRAAKLLRAVSWADRGAIAAIYAQAAEMTRATGVQHKVDHVIPLRGRNVSGLHVETNLQILTKRDNARKSNKV